MWYIWGWFFRKCIRVERSRRNSVTHIAWRSQNVIPAGLMNYEQEKTERTETGTSVSVSSVTSCSNLCLAFITLCDLCVLSGLCASAASWGTGIACVVGVARARSSRFNGKKTQRTRKEPPFHPSQARFPGKHPKKTNPIQSPFRPARRQRQTKPMPDVIYCIKATYI